MQRVSLFVVVLVAACGPKQFDSICDGNLVPAGCDESCDPAPGAPNTCAGGFHCSPDGKCDAQCTPGGDQCGAGYTCTDDGRCQDNSDPMNGPDATCAEVHFTAKPVTPSVHLVIDRSGTMDQFLGGGLTRYQAVFQALVDQSIGVVTNLQSKAYFGASLYTDDSPCPRLYSVGRAMNNRDSIANLIASQNPHGNTPTGGAINQVVADFAANPPPAGSPPVIVVATDGIPNNCNGDPVAGQATAIAAAQASFAAGIKLFMLAVASDINPGHLQAMANAGVGVQPGQPNAPFYLANNPADLRSAFDQIIGGVLSCDLTLNGTVDPGAAASGTVILNGMKLMFGTDWELAEPDGRRELLVRSDHPVAPSPRAILSAR